MKLRSLLSLAPTLALVAGLPAAESAPLTSEQILKRITVPAGFEATVFASPPQVSYPIFISAAPDGTLFVGCDENGSLDRQPGRGRVVMARDTDGDGRADQFSTFAKMDSPRGVAWDQSTRTLYVMHPPNLTAYHDDAGKGVANREEDLITGLGFGLDFRGADHTTNGIRLGIDGWIYIAVGDYGAVQAKGRDGRTLELRGGGIVRVRPDGTGMELVVRGTRNILAVAISPTLDLLTRDNTNDGDDWNDRLSFNPFGAEMGYPTLYRNFSDETIPAMVDFGGGSPVGAVYLDEPALPAEWSRGFYSVEWGRSEIALHPLEAKGAGWTANTRQFMKLTRATDLDADARGRLYAASWDGASFTYAGPNVGYVIGLTTKGKSAPAVPDFKRLDERALAALVGNGSAVIRQAAQRELLVRGPRPGVAEVLRRIAETDTNVGARVAAIFTLRLLLGADAQAALVALTDSPGAREFALKALADDVRFVASVPVAPFVKALADADPRVRLQAVIGLGRLGHQEVATAVLARTADADPVVAHVAVQALRWLRASEACFAALDGKDERLHPGALRVLQALPEPAVVAGLTARLERASGPLRIGIFATLSRLAFKEAPYTDPKMWWGTRPDTSGPIYKPERWEQSGVIEAALKRGLEQAQGAEATAFVRWLLRTKVTFPGATELILAKAGHDTASRLEVIGSLLSPKAPAAPELLGALRAIATNGDESVEIRAKALRLLAGQLEKNGDAVLDAIAVLGSGPQPPALAAVWEEVTRDTRHGRRAAYFGGLAKDSDAGKRLLGATVLVSLATNPMVKENRTVTAVRRALDGFWANRESALTLLEAINRARATTLAAKVQEAAAGSDAAVAAAARTTLERLGLAPGAAAGKTIGDLPYNEVVALVAKSPGDAARGRELFLQQACFACHTVSAQEPAKGPMLGGIARRYSRPELCESILKPSAKIAQGFESQHLKLKNGSELDGFVVREGGDSLDVRTIAGVTSTVEKGDIVTREKRDVSIMPEGLVSALAPQDLASLLAYLESTDGK